MEATSNPFKKSKEIIEPKNNPMLSEVALSTFMGKVGSTKKAKSSLVEMANVSETIMPKN
eukprot:CAMPEP_0170496782 /NCGR_PEP_ID=MMETSP0208-20121228/22683_1 /TAXON_ID=197538 /ORGANISM="Strombidium inclinatum, Strain S3" /LENGTH=59 /DNA_ID=CAMNT_0010773411 /DNA_START=505 /DNA_END=684 /DNA_ORIENTATION=-